MKIDLKELEKEIEENRIERLKFVKFWAEYIKKNDDEVWSEQQNMLINSQIAD